MSRLRAPRNGRPLGRTRCDLHRLGIIAALCVFIRTKLTKGIRMTTDTIKPGDVVELKSGGPAMTVEDIGNSGTPWANCSWFEGSKFTRETFELAALRIRPSDPDDLTMKPSGQVV